MAADFELPLHDDQCILRVLTNLNGHTFISEIRTSLMTVFHFGG